MVLGGADRYRNVLVLERNAAGARSLSAMHLQPQTSTRVAYETKVMMIVRLPSSSIAKWGDADVFALA